MKFLPLVLAASAALSCSITFAAEAPTTTATPIVGMFRLLKADGATVLRQAIVAPGMAMQTLAVSGSDAIAAANGRCAFNVKIEEVSQVALTGTTTRLYTHDTLVANASKIDLVAHTGKTIWTQPYLFAGNNYLKLVFDAESARPSIAWVQVRVDGTCLATGAPAPKPPVPAALPPVKPGSGDWNSLFNAYGYSNYAVHGLKTAGYGRYGALLELNAALTAAVKAGSVERAVYQTLLARWAAINADADFKALMAKVVPGGDKKV